jgi:hypothetical protein
MSAVNFLIGAAAGAPVSCTYSSCFRASARADARRGGTRPRQATGETARIRSGK